jgi:hypothetical protein
MHSPRNGRLVAGPRKQSPDKGFSSPKSPRELVTDRLAEYNLAEQEARWGTLNK